MYTRNSLFLIFSNIYISIKVTKNVFTFNQIKYPIFFKLEVLKQ